MGTNAGLVALQMADLHARERAAITAAEEISTEVLAKNAQQYDDVAVFPEENFEALRQAGLVGVVVPERYGGLGLRPSAYALFLRILARGCASTAGSFHMHNSVMVFLDKLATGPQKDYYYSKAVQGDLFGSWGAEQSTSWAGTVALNTGYVEVDGGYEISGEKYFCSLGEGAAYGHLWAVRADKVGQPNVEEVQAFIVPAASDGVEVVDRWDPLGMRASVSKPVVLRNSVVSEVARVGRPGDIRRIPTEFYGLGFAAFYAGIAEAAYTWAVEYAKTRVTRPLNVPIASFDRIQRKIGAMALQVHQAALAVDHAARYASWDGADPYGMLVEAMKAKAITTSAALAVTSMAIEVSGGPGVLRGMPSERYFRDARTATLMVPAYDHALETVAKNELGFQDREVH